MYYMCHNIAIGPIRRLAQIESVSIRSSIDTLTDTCTLTLVDSVVDTVLGIETSIKRGDMVSVQLGYNEQYHPEFTGYVASVSNTSPVQIRCEDGSFLFRKPVKDKAFKKTTVLALLTYVLEQVNPQLPAEQRFKLVTDLKGMQYDSFVIVNATGLQVLAKIKEQFGIAIYCRGRELHCHLLFTQKRGTVAYDFHKNIEAKSDLEFVKADERKVRVTVKGRGKKGGVTEVHAGEEGGDKVTISRPGITDQKTLANIAKQLVKQRTYDGYKGSIRGWLLPICEVGFTARVIDPDHPSRDGNYYVSSVRTEFSRAGGVRTVGLGIKLSAPDAILSTLKADYLDYE